MNYLFFLFLILNFFFPNTAQALDLPPLPKTYVSDFARILSPSQRQTLERQLTAIEGEGSSQVLLVTVPDLQGTTLEDYGIRLAEKWKPGHAGRDNGVILLVAPNERKVRIEVGYGLEGALTDALSKNIIETRMIPAFKRGDFFAGLEQGISAVRQAVQGEYRPLPVKKKSSGASGWVLLVNLVFFLTIFWVFIRLSRSYGIDRRGWHRGRGYRRSSWGGGWGGGFSGGSSGGFSSGGGSFGGGGASGSW